MKVDIIGASGKLGTYMVLHALDRGYEVVGLCRKRSVSKLDAFKGGITIIPSATNDREVIKKAVCRVRRSLHCAGPLGQSALIVGDSPGGTRLRTTEGTPHFFLRLAYHARLQGCVSTILAIARFLPRADTDD